MSWELYQEQAARTNSGAYHGHLVPIDALHAVIGIVTEAGELLDAVKRSLFYGKPLDLVNVKEELGDLEWYRALLYSTLGIEQSDVWWTNIAKLEKRYPEKYSDDKALNRNLDAERAVLEGKS